jgi:SnoaL-like polyketide cyclase
MGGGSSLMLRHSTNAATLCVVPWAITNHLFTKANLMTNDPQSHIKIIEDRFFNELWNAKNLETAEDIFTNEFITESISLEPSNWVSMHGKGPSSMKHHIKWWLRIIPDARMRVIDIAAIGNKVITNWELEGTMQGEIFEIKPKNQGVHIFGCTVSIFQGYKISLNKTLFDRLGFFQQINVLPPTEKIAKQA